MADWYDSGYYSISSERNPQGPGIGSFRVLRGGSWDGIPDNQQTTDRAGGVPEATIDGLGFRCARDP